MGVDNLLTESGKGVWNQPNITDIICGYYLIFSFRLTIESRHDHSMSVWIISNH